METTDNAMQLLEMAKTEFQSCFQHRKEQ